MHPYQLDESIFSFRDVWCTFSFLMYLYRNSCVLRRLIWICTVDYCLPGTLGMKGLTKWAASWQNQQNGMCAQRRLTSAWASAQSDQSSLSAWRKLGSLATHWAHSEDSDKTGRMPRLIWVFAGRTCHFVGFVMRWLRMNCLRIKSELPIFSFSLDFSKSSGLRWAIQDIITYSGLYLTR